MRFARMPARPQQAAGSLRDSNAEVPDDAVPPALATSCHCELGVIRLSGDLGRVAPDRSTPADAENLVKAPAHRDYVTCGCFLAG